MPSDCVSITVIIYMHYRQLILVSQLGLHWQSKWLRWVYTIISASIRSPSRIDCTHSIVQCPAACGISPSISLSESVSKTTPVSTAFRDTYEKSDWLVYANSLLATLNGRVVTRASNPMAINSLRISTLKFDTSTIAETVRPVQNSPRLNKMQDLIDTLAETPNGSFFH